VEGAVGKCRQQAEAVALINRNAVVFVKRLVAFGLRHPDSRHCCEGDWSLWSNCCLWLTRACSTSSSTMTHRPGRNSSFSRAEGQLAYTQVLRCSTHSGVNRGLVSMDRSILVREVWFRMN